MKKLALPIAAFREKIVEAVKNNPVTVIMAETGAGKSTQVPQYLLDEGYDLVVTQPRRLAAHTVAQRVAEEIGEKLGGTVGYRTAVTRQDSQATRCLFCTDGLALVRELVGVGVGGKAVLVLDEVHEWNENIEVLVAWAKRQVESGVDFKVVLMSATLEAEKLSAFYNNAPVITVPGRMFPVEVKDAGERLVDDVADLVRNDRNVLVFQPGKQEIAETCAALEQMRVNAEILPLHGQLTPEEQAKCFKHYGRPKVVVSTNVAQTSVTIDDIDAVVDSGMERRIELVDGVEGLYLKPVSLADSVQRKGRAGRTKKGVYVDHCDSTNHPDFPVAEILRKRLDQAVLRLAIAGFDMEELEFFHQPEVSDIHDARQTLIGLGCMNAEGSVTRIGKLVNRLPVSVQYGRMLVEADRLGVIDDTLTVAAIMEIGGITVPPPSRNRPDRPDWREIVPDEHESDVIGQLRVWDLAKTMSKDEMYEAGISLRNYFRAKEIRRQLEKAVKRFFQFGSTGRREDILKAICAGMVDHLYKNSYGSYQNSEGVNREIGTASCVRGAEWLVGKPFDLQIKTRRGTMTLNLIELASKVDPMWLAEVAPQLVEQKSGLSPRYDGEKDIVVSTTHVFFNKQMVREEAVADGEHPEAATVFARWLASQRELSTADDASATARKLSAVFTANAERQEQARQLNIRTGEETFKVYSSDEMFERFATALSGARRIVEVQRPEALALPALDEDKVEKVLSNQPDTISVLGSDTPVEYRSGYTPRVKLEGEMVGENRWLSLPDEGVRLPGGRLVEVVVSFGYYAEISGSDIPKLKEKVREHLNQKQWDNWSDKPEVSVPDPAVEGSEIPFITACYGKCVVTGEELNSYGTILWDSWYSRFSVKWYRDEEEAQKARTDAQQKLAGMREKAMQKRELEVAKVETESLREVLRGLTSRDGWDDLDSELRREVEGKRYSYLPSSIEELRECKAETEALVAKVEVTLAEVAHNRARREEIEEQLNELRNLHGWPAAYIIVREDGEVAVNCGKQSKVGTFDVSPSLCDRQYGPEALDDEGRLVMWQPIPAGRKVAVCDYSGSGNLMSEVSFTVPESKLEPGVWAVTEDGETFYPVIYWNGHEVVPGLVKAVSAEPDPDVSESGEDADLSQVDLSKLFGGNVRIR